MNLAMNIYERFWKSIENKKTTINQLDRYKAKNAPDYIQKFIEIGGGAKMGVTLEEYARFNFKTLQKRKKGKEETGYDHISSIRKNFYIEQKSSGHWGDEDYKWQHVELKHKWNMLLLCGIDYTDIKFWGMSKVIFEKLITEGKITNQGNKAGDSSEGMWFNYSSVKDYITELKTDDELQAFIKLIPETNANQLS
jgi:hypothetical protein